MTARIHHQRRPFTVANKVAFIALALVSTTGVAFADLDGDVTRRNGNPSSGGVGGPNGNGIDVYDGAISSAEIENESIQQEDIADDAVGAGEISSGAVGSDEVLDGSLSAADLGANSVGAEELNAGAVAQEVGAALLSDPAIVADFSDQLADVEANASALLTDLSTNSNEASQGALAASLGNNLVVTGGAGNGTAATVGTVAFLDIANQSVTEDDLANGSVTTAKIQNGAVTTAKLQDGGVTTAKIQNGAVTNTKLSTGAVDSRTIKDGSIQSVDLADGAVTTQKLSPNLRNRLDGLDQGLQTANGGVSMAFAMANIPQLSGEKDYSVGFGVGSYQDQTAFAFGLNARLDDGVVGRMSLSRSGKGDWGAGAGLAFEW